MKKISLHDVIGILILIGVVFAAYKIYTLETQQKYYEASPAVCAESEDKTNCDTGGTLLEDATAVPTRPKVMWSDI